MLKEIMGFVGFIICVGAGVGVICLATMLVQESREGSRKEATPHRPLPEVEEWEREAVLGKWEIRDSPETAETWVAPPTFSVVEVLMELENFSATPYKDTTRWSIGYGTRALARDERISREEGRCRMEEYLREEVYPLIRREVKVALRPHQEAALAVFVYNVGGSAFRNSTLLELLNKGQYDAVPEQLRRWIHAGGKKLEGLRERREREVEIWLGK